MLTEPLGWRGSPQPPPALRDPWRIEEYAKVGLVAALFLGLALAVSPGAFAGETLAAGANVNARGDDGGTALHAAAVAGEADAVRLLLAAGADVNARRNGLTALDMAEGHAEVVRLLRAAGASSGAR